MMARRDERLRGRITASSTMAGIDRQLRIGQTVRLTEVAAGYHIAVLAAEESGHKVVQVGADYVVCDNEAAGIKTRIPVHFIVSIKAATVGAERVAGQGMGEVM